MRENESTRFALTKVKSFDVRWMLVPENSNLPYVKFLVLTYAFSGIFTLLQQEGLIVPFLHWMHRLLLIHEIHQTYDNPLA
jgi:hypothetical protein